MYRVQFWKRKNKYGAKRAEHNGVSYHSKLEAEYAADLDYRLRAGDIAGWKRQIHIPIVSHGVRFGTYIVDFLIEHNDGTLEYVEVKGKGLSAGMNKFRWLEKIFRDDPKIKVRLVRG